MTESALCVAPGCRIPRQHYPHCATDGCRGCLPAPAEVGNLCSSCHARTRTWLAEIPELYAEVVDPLTAVDTRVWDRTWETVLVHDRHTASCDGTDCRGCLPLSEVAGPGTYRVRRQAWRAPNLPADPVAGPTPAGLVLAGGHTPRVSGSREPGVSARLNEAGPGTTRLRRDRYGHLWVDDQVGDPPTPITLDTWARDWQHLRGDRELLPRPTVAALCSWLAARLDWAAAEHPAVDEFVDEIRHTHSRLRLEAGRGEPRPELCIGVPCRRCDLLSLWRLADGSGDVECSNPSCRTVYNSQEYRRWVGLVAAGTTHENEG